MIRAFRAFLDFCYIARRAELSETDLNELDGALGRFHQHRRIFQATGVREDGPGGFSLPRQHAMVHYRDMVEEFGAPCGLCSSITESKHIVAVKEPYRRSSHYEALGQMLLINQRLDKLAACRRIFEERGMLKYTSLERAVERIKHLQQEVMRDAQAAGYNETEDDAGAQESDHAASEQGADRPAVGGAGLEYVEVDSDSQSGIGNSQSGIRDDGQSKIGDDGQSEVARASSGSPIEEDARSEESEESDIELADIDADSEGVETNADSDDEADSHEEPPHFDIDDLGLDEDVDDADDDGEADNLKTAHHVFLSRVRRAYCLLLYGGSHLISLPNRASLSSKRAHSWSLYQRTWPFGPLQGVHS
jgi:hypothetical protein